jgi:hypothetical protein
VDGGIDPRKSRRVGIRDARGICDEREFSEQLGLWDRELRSRFNVVAVGFCFSKYISSELDCHTPGDRGLGRIATEIPRLRAYFRRPMSRLSLPELRGLYGIIEDLMLRGYLTRAVLFEGPPKQPILTTAPALYEAWLAGFHSPDPSQMGPNLRAVLAPPQTPPSPRWMDSSVDMVCEVAVTSGRTRPSSFRCTTRLAGSQSGPSKWASGK